MTPELLSSYRRSLQRDIKRVRAVSARIEGRLRESEDARMDRLTGEQLRDLGEVTRLAGYMLARHEDSRDMRDMLREFVDMINGSAESISELDGQIEELALSAEAAIRRIRDAREGVCGGAGGEDAPPEGGSGGSGSGGGSSPETAPPAKCK